MWKCFLFLFKLWFFFEVSPDKMNEIQAQLDLERKQLAAMKNLEENERNKLARNIEKRENELRKAQ